VAGCQWILGELATIRQHIETHPWLFHYRRVRLLNLLGKKPQDAITADPVAVRWVPVLVGAVYGRQPDVEHQVHLELGNAFPDSNWMHLDEYDAWLKKLAAMVPERNQARLLPRRKPAKPPAARGRVRIPPPWSRTRRRRIRKRRF
jgi:hypothetical protein